MKLFLVGLMTVVSFASNAEHAKGEHREHHAHKHGAAKMAIAFEGQKGKITLELASEGVYGFEYAPKKEADIKKQKDGLAKLENEISSMVSFDSKLKCVIAKEKIEVDQHEGGKHSDIDASFNVNCAADPTGTSIVFNVQKSFPKLKDVDVQILIGDLQKSVEANKNGFAVELKK